MDSQEKSVTIDENKNEIKEIDENKNFNDMDLDLNIEAEMPPLEAGTQGIKDEKEGNVAPEAESTSIPPGTSVPTTERVFNPDQNVSDSSTETDVEMIPEGRPSSASNQPQQQQEEKQQVQQQQQSQSLVRRRNFIASDESSSNNSREVSNTASTGTSESIQIVSANLGRSSNRSSVSVSGGVGSGSTSAGSGGGNRSGSRRAGSTSSASGGHNRSGSRSAASVTAASGGAAMNTDDNKNDQTNTNVQNDDEDDSKAPANSWVQQLKTIRKVTENLNIEHIGKFLYYQMMNRGATKCEIWFELLEREYLKFLSPEAPIPESAQINFRIKSMKYFIELLGELTNSATLAFPDTKDRQLFLNNNQDFPIYLALKYFLPYVRQAVKG